MACNTNNNFILPDEIWIEIFLRCSVKSLLRAICVCKKWHVLIKNPNFTFSHLGYQKKHDKGRLLLQYFTRETGQFRYILFDDETLTRDTYHELDHFHLSDRQYMHIEGPVDGLYCLYNYCDRIVLWNPALKKLKVLPLPHPYYLPHVKVYEGQIGFGLDPLTKSYKLVLIRCFEDTINLTLDDLNVTVYNFSTNTWRLLDLGNFPIRTVVDNLNSTFLDGICYWWDQEFVFAFDMGKELFRKILGPDFSDSESYGSPTIYDDHLALLFSRENYCDVWVMLDEGVWIKQFIIAHPSRFDLVLGFWNTNMILYAIPEKEASCSDGNYQMVLCDVRHEAINVGPGGLLSCHRASVYHESLVFFDEDHNPYSDIKRS